ncbi:MAG TPA: ABC transporter substrate-binding protein [Methylomirabilota bacterium]|jgi:branched-chain amino acid transport system substrate-binding protein|nr:ABC transporter substrate-binding protein [Methylomirabilota bacterium]
MRVILALALSVLALGWGVPAAYAQEAYKIGAIFSITGPGSSLGIPERDTALMVEAEVNAKGGVKGPDGKLHPLKLVIYDDASDETKAVLAAKKLIDEDKVTAIVGTTLSGTSLAILDTVQKAEVPLVSCAAAAKIVEPAAERKWVFKTPQSDFLITGVLADYLKAKGLTKVAWLNVDYAFGQLGWIEFEKAAQKAGLTIVANEKFGQKDVDMTAQLTKVKAANPQATVIWSIPPSASIATKNYADLGIKAPMFQSHGVGNKKYIELAGPASNGVLFPAGKLLVAEQLTDNDPQKAVLLAYAKDFEAKYGARNTFGGHAWDALYIVLGAMQKAGTDRAKVRSAIEATRNFVGITGVFDFSPADHNGLDRRAATMIQIVDGQWRMAK